ncbi:MAG: penicillin acylase family protein [Actinomycetota bacterium]
MALLSVAVVLAVVPGATGQAPAGDRPPRQAYRVVSILPPGQSGYYTAEDQGRGSATRDPGDYGKHVDDQREPYWAFEFKPGSFHAEGEPEAPKEGVRIYRDPFGVPSVYADNEKDLWYGAGWAVARDRLFQLDAIRRVGRGTIAELTGRDAVPGDIRTRVLTYSDAEYERMFAALPQDLQDAFDGYVAGVNAWIERVRSDPSLLPAEYEALSTLPEPVDRIDLLAAAVLIVRGVASAGGQEFENVRTLRDLTTMHGKRTGRLIFKDVVWLDEAKAPTTIPRSEGTFRNQPDQAASVFRRWADYADRLPLGLETGPGTGAAPAPILPDDIDPTPLPFPDRGADAAREVEQVVHAIEGFRNGIKGGSYLVAIAPQRSNDGALLVSGPQVGYAYPNLLVEHEVHGAGHHARGISVAGIPVVGIGYGKRTAWGLTTGNSKTIDSFIERVRTTDDGTKQYFHAGRWSNQRCRIEVVRYRAALTGPQDDFEEHVEVCRTGHGPIVATSEDGNDARSVQFALWKRELDSIEGMFEFSRADNLKEFVTAVKTVSWNENVMYADADGHILYWHPGLYPKRHPGVDQRFPVPGTGAFDWRGLIETKDMPHVIDPRRGWIANWNNKPAQGWKGAVSGSTPVPYGRGFRIKAIFDLLRRNRRVSFEELQDLERKWGTTDFRAREFVPLLLRIRRAGSPGERMKKALDLLEGWSGSTFGEYPRAAAEPGTDGPAPTIFDEFVTQLRRELFAEVLPEDVFLRESASPSHLYEMETLDNLALRILKPTSSALPVHHDWLGKRRRLALLEKVLTRSLSSLQDEYGSQDPNDYRRDHAQVRVCSLTGGVVGPCTAMPFLFRGSWIQMVGFRAAPNKGRNE